MTRVLVTITPRMYRQAIVFSLQRQRPGLDVRIAAPEATHTVLANFLPHLLLHNDNDRLELESVTAVPFRIEVQYSDGMDARISADGEVSRAQDMSAEELLFVVDRAIALADREANLG